MTKKTLNVKGMHCKSCILLVKEALEEIGASNINIKLDEKNQVGKLYYEFEGNESKIISAIKKEGYEATK